METLAEAEPKTEVPAATDETGPQPARRELGTLLHLALPLIAGHAGSQLMSFVDTAMVGRLGSAALGGVGIGNGLFFTVTVFGFGAVLGMDAPISQAVGARELGRARRILWQGIRVALLVGLPIMAIVALSPLLLERAGVQPEPAAQARAYLFSRLPNIWPMLLFAAVRSYLQALGLTRPIVLATVIGNAVNLVGNLVLIWGDATLVRVGLPAIGLPALGVVGSGLSSSIASVVMLGVVAYAVRLAETPADPERRKLDRAAFGTILRLGSPLGLQLLAEVGIFAFASVLAGGMNPEAAAGHQVAITLASFSFCVTIGIASAGAVRVGHAVGRGDSAGVRRSGAIALGASLAFMAASATVFATCGASLARILTDDPAVIAAAVPLITIAAFFQLSDGTQATGAGILRGAGDAHAPLWANLAGHYLVGLPLVLLLGTKGGMNWGAPGIWWGLSAGLTAVAVGLVARFLVISRRPIARV